MTSFFADKTLLVIGLGLIGGSLAKSCRSRGIFSEVLGFSRNAATRSEAVRLNVVDEVSDHLPELLGRADFVYLAVPILATESVIRQIQPYLKPGATVSDGGSVKGCVADAARNILSAEQLTRFVPGHPIAGAEKSGVTAARDDLYINHRIILTPLAENDTACVQQWQTLWQLLGAEVDMMEIGHHDEVLAATSHLPHLLAFNIVDTLARKSENREIFHYAAGGFRDFTRIAASDPVMWHDIFVANRSAVLAVLDDYVSELHKLRNAVSDSDSDYMMSVFREAKASREHFSEILEDRARKIQEREE